MDKIDDPRISAGLKALIAELVAGDYTTMIANKRLDGMADVVHEYLDGYLGQITMPPDEAFELVELWVNDPFEKDGQHWDFWLDIHLWADGAESELYASVWGYERDDKTMFLKIRSIVS
jgi:hypothetical protein